MKKIVLLCLLLAVAPCWADSPLPPPATEIVYSRSRFYFAQTNPKSNTTTGYRRIPIYTRGKMRIQQGRMWKMKGYFRALHLANDGQHLVASYEGANLLALEDARPQTNVLRFFRSGKPLRNVSLGEMKLSKANLRRTISHWAWREGEGFDASGLFYVYTIDGRIFYFNPRSGRLVKTAQAPAST